MIRNIYVCMMSHITFLYHYIFISYNDVAENVTYYGNNSEYRSYQMKPNRLTTVSCGTGISIALEVCSKYDNK